MLLLLIIIPLTLIIIMGLWIYNLDLEIQQRLESRNFVAPTTYYSDIIRLTPGDTLYEKWTDLSFVGFRLRQESENLFPLDKSYWSIDFCKQKINSLPETTNICFATYLGKTNHPDLATERLQIVALDENKKVLATYIGSNAQPAESFFLPPIEIAQYLNNEPILRKQTDISEIPSACLNAVTAIEDQHFLNHGGVSATGIARAFFKNLVTQRAAQGGSTITQQLAKNYFLTPEKTLKRKATEFIMAFLIEGRLTKDQILETYLNIIYLGQQGSHQIRGYGAAANYYFAKPLQELNLSECALMAAIINSPGNYNPWTKAENASKRRNVVLKKMFELNLITTDEKISAENQPLPKKSTLEISATAPYFFEAAQRELKELGILAEGMSIYTTLSPFHQQAAQSAVNKHLENLEVTNDKIKKLKVKGKRLEGIFLSAENETGAVRSLVGGRSFRKSQFNRVLDAQRSIGSTIKPFVYLTAPELSPLLPVEDLRFTHTFDKQSWSPENYDKKYHGKVPAFYALKNSLNAAAGKLGISLSPEKIIETLRTFKITSPIQPLPSIALGTFSVKATELLQAYTIIAKNGSYIPLHFNTAIIDPDGNVVYQFKPEAEQVIDAKKVAVLVGMMKQTMISGTAKSSQSRGINFPAAGKTGTTNDNKDTWFVGFTPTHAALAWTGFDDNSSSGLTGASGALPIWADYFSSLGTNSNKLDFPVPEDCEIKTVTDEDLKEDGLFPENEESSQQADLLFCD